MAKTSRRKTSRRKGSSAHSVMMKRLGLRGWNNSRPFFGWSKSITTKTLGSGHNPGVTTGAIFQLPVNNWNDPIGNGGTLVDGTGTETSNRHPMDHDAAIASGYERVQVLSWKGEITINWIAGASNENDFIVAYTFSENAGSAVQLTAGGDGRTERKEILTNPRWTTKAFNAVPGVLTGARRDTKIVISVPNVFAYCEKIAQGSLDVIADNGTISHEIRDVAFDTNPPLIALFCNIVIMTESGGAMAINSINVTIAVTQRVKIYRDANSGNDMVDGEADIHA